MANIEESVYSDPNFAVICSFLEKFGDSCGIPGFTIVTLQEMLEDTRNVHPDLVDLHVKLLRRAGKKSVTHVKWEKVLVKYCHGYSKVDAWEIERFGYKKAKLGVKISLLKRLLEAQFDTTSKFKTDVNKLSAEQLRLLPIGKDLKGLMYWFQLDNDLNLRVYCEDQDEETWELIVRERGELVSLIENLETNGNPGLKKEEDSTTPSDTGESKDGEGSLGIHVSQDKQENLTDEKLQFRVPLLICKEEEKPQFEVPASVSVMEDKKVVMKLEPMEIDIHESMTTKKETLPLKIEKSENQDSSISDVPTKEITETKHNIKIKEEPMLIDEDTIVEPEILKRNSIPLPSAIKHLSITETINSRAEQEQVIEEMEMENGDKEIGNSEAVQDLSSGVRASVIKLAEKPAKADAPSQIAEAALPDLLSQTLASSVAEHSQEEAADLSVCKKKSDAMKEDASAIQGASIIKDCSQVTDAVTPENDKITKGCIADLATPASKNHGAREVVREPPKPDQEHSDKDRCERMKMPLKKRNIPKDLDTGDSRPAVLDIQVKCQIPLIMEPAPVQPVGKDSDTKIHSDEVVKSDITVSTHPTNLSQPNVPTNNLPISSCIEVDAEDTVVTINDKLEDLPSTSEKSAADISKEHSKCETSDNLSVQLIDTGQTLALEEKDITSSVEVQRNSTGKREEPSEGCTNAGSKDSEFGKLRVAKLKLKKNSDGSTTIDLPENSSVALQLSDDKDKQTSNGKLLLDDSNSEIQKQMKNLEGKSDSVEVTNTAYLSSRDITEGNKDQMATKVALDNDVESSMETGSCNNVKSDKMLPHLQETTVQEDMESKDCHTSCKKEKTNKMETVKNVETTLSDKSDNTTANASSSKTMTSKVGKLAEKAPSTFPLQNDASKFEIKPAELSDCPDRNTSTVQESHPKKDSRIDLQDEAIQNNKTRKPVECSESQDTVGNENSASIKEGNVVKKTAGESSVKEKCDDCKITTTNTEDGIISDCKRRPDAENQKCEKEKHVQEDDESSTIIKEKASSPEIKLSQDASKDLTEESIDNKMGGDTHKVDVVTANKSAAVGENIIESIMVAPVADELNSCLDLSDSKMELVQADLDSKDSDKNASNAEKDVVVVKKRRRSKKTMMLACPENNDLPNDVDGAALDRRMTRSLRPRPGQPPVIPKPTIKEKKALAAIKRITAQQQKEVLNDEQPKVRKRMGRPPKKKPILVKVITPKKPRGRKKAVQESQSLDSSDDGDVSENPKAPTKKRKLEPPDVEEDSFSSIKRSPRLRAQRQKVRSEQQLIEEEMQRRALVAKQKRSYMYQKKKKLAAKGQENRDGDKREIVIEEEMVTAKSRKKMKKKKHLGSKRRKKGTNPWDCSSESTSASSEPEERNEEAEDDDEELVFNVGSDHEFSPESEPEPEDPNYVPTTVKRARTVKQAKSGSGEESNSSSEDDKPCNKCGKYDHPEWILLCDKCDIGYHTSCLRPPLLVIPDGDWYCPPCGHKILVERLHEQLKNLDQLLKKRDREEMRKKRLAYVGISLDNVLKPEKKESVGDEEELEEVKDEGDSDDDYTLLRKRSKRQRKEVSYRFKEFDELIKSAIHDEPVLDSLETGMTGVGKGKDMSNIRNASPEESEFDIISNRKKRKHRRWKDLNSSTEEEEDDSDEDFKGASTNSEQVTEEDSGGAQDDSDDGSWQGEGRSGRSYRRRGRHNDSDFINDSDLDSDDNRRTVRRAAAKSVNYRELSESDDGGRKQKRIDNTRSKSSRGAISDDSEEESEDSDWKKSKKHSTSSSKSKQRTGRKAWRIDSDEEEEDSEEEEDTRHRHTRGKKTSYEEVLDSSNSEEEVRKSKKNSRLNISDFAKDSEDEESPSENGSDEEDEEEDEEDEKKPAERENASKDTVAATSEAKGQEVKVGVTESPPNNNCETQSLATKTSEMGSFLQDSCKVELLPKKICETPTVSADTAKQSGKTNVVEAPALPSTSEKVLKSPKSIDETNTPVVAEKLVPTKLGVDPAKIPAEETAKASVIKSVESVKKGMVEITKASSQKLENDEKDLAVQKKVDTVKPLVEDPGFVDRVRPSDFPDRPSPLKPSAVEPYPVESSPSKLMLLDTYPPARGSPQAKLTPLEPYSSPTAAPQYDRPRMAGPSTHYHADYGNYPGQYYSPNYPPPGNQYSPSPPMPAYQSSPNPYPPFQQPSPSYGYMPQGYAEQGPFHGPPQQYSPYGNYSPPPQPPPAGPPPQSQPNGRFTIDNLLQRRMEGASEDDDFSTVNDLVSYITGSSSTSQENPL